MTMPLIFFQNKLDRLKLISGEFRGGRIWGNGLLTFRDGVSATEGYFQGPIQLNIFSIKIDDQNQFYKAFS